MKRLSRHLLADGHASVELPTAAQLALPEKAVQFGTGAFLRGFVDYFIDEANRAGRFNGRVVAVSSTGSTRDAALNEQDGLFTLVTRGVERHEPREHYRVIGALSRALSAQTEWDAVLAVARDPNIELVFSNTTEIGIVLDETDTCDATPPKSFPGKLTRFLAERARAFDYDPRRGVIVLPTELIDDNGAALRDIVLSLAKRWALGKRFEHWIDTSVTFCNTLVDRIVPGPLTVGEHERVSQQLGYHDDMLTSCETYALFAIEGDDALRARLAFPGDDPRIVVTPDIRPYRQRKVRVLNGGHTIGVPTALLAGFETVRDACDDERLGAFVRRVIFDEIVPSLEVPDAESFARDVFDRFANPYIRHSLVDITLYNTTKLRVRVVPSILEYQARTKRVPTSLAFGFAAYLAFMRGEVHATRSAAGLSMPEDAEGSSVHDAWRAVDVSNDGAIAGFVRRVMSNAALWGVDLRCVDGFSEAVTDHLVRIVRLGVEPALDIHLTETAPT